MNAEILNCKKLIAEKVLSSLSDFERENAAEHFAIEYTHDSAAIDGNSISLIDTRLILIDGIAPAETRVRELDEVRSHADAWNLVKECASRKEPLDEERIREIHRRVSGRSADGGQYRSIQVYIKGASHIPPAPEKVPHLMADFCQRLSQDDFPSGIEKAALAHAELTGILPFRTVNGLTARLIMNFLLMEDGFLPVSIRKDSSAEYFAALESYALENDPAPFTEFLARLEEKALDDFLWMYRQHIRPDAMQEISQQAAEIARQYAEP